LDAHPHLTVEDIRPAARDAAAVVANEDIILNIS
jgi:hypothetical protein